MNTLQQLRRRSILGAIKTLWERCVDAVKTLCTRYNWQIIYILGVFHGNPTAQSALTGVLKAVKTLLHCRFSVKGAYKQA